MERAGQVDREHAFPVLDGDIEEGRVQRQPGACHHDLDRPELAPRRLECLLHRGPVADVGAESNDARPFGPKFGCRPVGRGRIQVEQPHAGAPSRETADDRQADTRSAAGHNCHPAQQFSSFVAPDCAVPPP